MIHVMKAGEVSRLTKTLCGTLLESLPRVDGSVEYKNRHNVTCEKCNQVIVKIETMRKGN